MQDQIKDEWIEALQQVRINGQRIKFSDEYARLLIAAVAPLIRAELEAERDEADRRAGAAERRAADLQEGANARASWLYRAKRERGYHDNVSFDVVWAETCAKADRSDADLAQAQAQIAALRNVVEAWESLPGGRPYGPKTVEAWLCGAMKRAIDDARAALKEPSHDH